MRWLIVGVLCLLWVTYAQAGKPERWYQEAWCKGVGVTEYRLSDGARVDCLTDSHAIEFDFDKKWAEAIGQALYYATKTHKKAGIVLIVGKDGQRYVARLRQTIQGFNLPIDVWVMHKAE